MIISFASGKGGTGKTTVATNFALFLSQETDAKKIQFLDCDVEEPNAAIFLRPKITETSSVGIPVPVIDFSRCTFCGKCSEVCAYHAIAVINPTRYSRRGNEPGARMSQDMPGKSKKNILVFPELCHGCGGCSLFCPEDAISETDRAIGVIEAGTSGAIDFVQGRLSIGEPMAPPVIRVLKQRIERPSTLRNAGKQRAKARSSIADRHFTIIDVPPGTSCPMVEAIRGSDFTLLVTEPTPFGLNDLKLAVATVREMDIRCGVIINRDGMGDSGVTEYCENAGIPVVMRIPMDRNIAVAYSKGIPMIKINAAYRDKFRELYQNIVSLS
ncbi:ATP-binding protein [candidate division WOR-3 bacterium]|nr:ATP-binding protein [candidate division WOR-3 bacterium]